MRKIFLVFLAAAAALQTGGLAGTWHFEQTTQNGRKREVNYVFKVEGNQFSGTTYTLTNRQEVVNGKIDGNKITFDVKFEYDDPPRLTPYKGEMNGDELKVTPATPPPAGRPLTEVILHRISDSTVFNPPPALMPTHKPFPPFQPIEPNGLAKTPPMGWNSWNKFAGRIDDKAVRAVADAMVTSGMRDAGYVYVNIDDTWEAGRDAQGNILSNEKFPDMKALADYVHSKGLKIGIYSSPGRKTCAGFEATYGHEEQDARTFAGWGIDYLKYDWCSASAVYHRDDMAPAYQKMALALRATGRPIIFSLCQYGWLHVEQWGAQAGGNLWRTTGDISDRWDSMSRIGFGQDGHEKYAGPGHWNDPDMLEIGNGGMTHDEYVTHMTLWCLLAAPLLAGNDIAAMSADTTAILTNKEAIAVNQDAKGVQGHRVAQEGSLEVWAKPLADGSVAVGLFNRGDDTAKVTVRFADAGARSSAKLRDLWKHEDLGAFKDQFTADVPKHGAVLIKVQ
jgi:alpha-galactosidase